MKRHLKDLLIANIHRMPQKLNTGSVSTAKTYTEVIMVAKIKSLFTKFVEYCEVAGTARAQRHIEMYGQQRIWE